MHFMGNYNFFNLVILAFSIVFFAVSYYYPKNLNCHSDTSFRDYF